MLNLKQVKIQGNYANDSNFTGVKQSKPYVSPENSDDVAFDDDIEFDYTKNNKMEMDTWSKSK